MAVIVLVVTGGPVRAQENSPPTGQPPTPLESPAESSVETNGVINAETNGVINAETNGVTTPETTAPESSAEDVVWPPPFNPSEEIGADSQVSFPTDI